jgi:preprotein translocase subunit SecF
MRRTPKLRIVHHARRWGVVSGLLIVLAVGSLFGRGLELSLDFVGGSSFRVEGIGADVTPDLLRTTVEGVGVSEAVAQVSGSGAERAAVIRTESLAPDSELARAVRAALVGVTGVADVQETFVGPTWGERIATQSLRALIVFLLVVTLYISVRLDRKMAVVAIATMAHDVLITIGIYALVGFSVSPATVIAILTILGYSLYDTVVVFDRVKDNAHTMGEPGRRTILELESRIIVTAGRAHDLEVMYANRTMELERIQGRRSVRAVLALARLLGRSIAALRRSAPSREDASASSSDSD